MSRKCVKKDVTCAMTVVADAGPAVIVVVPTSSGSASANDSVSQSLRIVDALEPNDDEGVMVQEGTPGACTCAGSNTGPVAVDFVDLTDAAMDGVGEDGRDKEYEYVLSFVGNTVLCDCELFLRGKSALATRFALPFLRGSRVDPGDDNDDEEEIDLGEEDPQADNHFARYGLMGKLSNTPTAFDAGETSFVGGRSKTKRRTGSSNGPSLSSELFLFE